MDIRAVVKVRILGEEYTLRTEASPEHTRAVAEHVDRTIRAILSGS
jgi:cell division protein ZapA